MTDNLDPTTAAITISTLWLLVGYRCWISPTIKNYASGRARRPIKK